MAEADPLLEHDDDNDEGNTNHFQPDSSSTPGPSEKEFPMTKMA